MSFTKVFLSINDYIAINFFYLTDVTWIEDRPLLPASSPRGRGGVKSGSPRPLGEGLGERVLKTSA